MATAYGEMNWQAGAGRHQQTGAASLTAAFAANANFRNYVFQVVTNAQMRQSTGGIPSVNLPVSVTQSLGDIQDLWNLDRSEAARRVYIDSWMTSAIVAARNGTSIITAEEAWSNATATANGWPGYGSMDYLVCEMTGPPAPIEPVYTPSLIGEAKSRLDVNQFNGVGQLVAEIDTVRTRTVYTDPIRGLVTDGRYWRFIEVLPRNNDVLLTPLYDSGTPDDWRGVPPNWHDARLVWGRLRQFFSSITSTQVLLI